MAFVLVRHRVNDFAAWKSVFDGVIGMRRAGGERYYQLFEPEDEPNHVIALFTWDSLENARRFFASSELQRAMSEAGVSEVPDIYYLKESNQGATTKE